MPSFLSQSVLRNERVIVLHGARMHVVKCMQISTKLPPNNTREFLLVEVYAYDVT